MTTKTEQNIQKPTLPQSMIYSNLKQSIVNAVKESGLPPWVLVDMLTNITVSVQTVGDQITNNEISNYNKQLEAYNAQEEKKRFDSKKSEKN